MLGIFSHFWQGLYISERKFAMKLTRVFFALCQTNHAKNTGPFRNLSEFFLCVYHSFLCVSKKTLVLSLTWFFPPKNMFSPTLHITPPPPQTLSPPPIIGLWGPGSKRKFGLEKNISFNNKKVNVLISKNVFELGTFQICKKIRWNWNCGKTSTLGTFQSCCHGPTPPRSMAPKLRHKMC